MKPWIISGAALAACVAGTGTWLATRDPDGDLVELEKRVAARDALANPEWLPSLDEIAPGWQAEMERRRRDTATLDAMLAEVSAWKATEIAQVEPSSNRRKLERLIDACESRALDLLAEAEESDAVSSVERVAALRRAVDAIQYVESLDRLIAWGNEFWSWLE